MKLLLLLACLLGGLAYTRSEAIPVPTNCAATSAAPGVTSAARVTSSTRPGRGDPREGPSGHAHNDFVNTNPLADALDAGFTSIEADVWSVDGRLLVAHERGDAETDRTLTDLYLRPLAARYAADPAAGPVQVVIDVKSEARSTVPDIAAALEPYHHLLTSYRGCRVHHRQVSVILSGDARPTDPALAAGDSVTRYAYDFQPTLDSDLDLPSAAIPLISSDWRSSFAWRGRGAMPRREFDRLTAFVRTAHAHGARVRFWGAPDEPGAARDRVWQAMTRAGVDFLNTDDLSGYADFTADAGG